MVVKNSKKMVHDYSPSVRCVACGQYVPECENGTTLILQAGRYVCFHEGNIGPSDLSLIQRTYYDLPSADGQSRFDESETRSKRLKDIFEGKAND